MTDQDRREHDEQVIAGDPVVADAVQAVDQMIQVVDDLETYVIVTHSRDRHGTSYRLNLLWLHAFAALLMAPLMTVTGREGLTGSTFVFMRSLPGAPYSLAAILGVGGLILGWGCIFRAKRTEMVGLAFLAAFYLLVGICFAVPPIRWLCEGGHGPKPPMYAPILYAHMSTIMAAHIRGLIQVRRDIAAVRAIHHQQQQHLAQAGVPPSGPHPPEPTP